MFEHFFFIYLNLFLRTIFIRIIIFILSYYVVSLPYLYLGFLKFSISLCPAMSYLCGCIHVRASLVLWIAINGNGIKKKKRIPWDIPWNQSLVSLYKYNLFFLLFAFNHSKKVLMTFYSN